MDNIAPFYTRLPFGAAFLGARAQRLADLLTKQGDEFFRSAGIVVPVRSASTLLYVHNHGPSSLVQIAKGLNESHQLTAQRTDRLKSLAMVSSKADPKDKRRRLFALTSKGRREVKLVESQCERALEIFAQLERQIGFRLSEGLDAAYAALARESMLARSDVEQSV